MFNFFKKKEKEEKQVDTKNEYENIKYGFYQDNLEDYIYKDNIENTSDLCIIEYKKSLKKYCIRNLGINDEKLIICVGDISKIKCDVVINAARPSLLGGGGVDGAIHAAAGPELVEECKTLNGCDYGEAKITNGYNMHCKKIIHTVGPIYKDGKSNENEILKNAYINSLNLAIENNLKTIAFPAISCGNYGYPIDEGTKIAFDIAIKYLKEHNDLKIIFVVNNSIYREFQKIIDIED